MPTTHSRNRIFVLGLLAAAFGLSIAQSARANGAFPEVSQLAPDPSDPTHLVLRSNFGLLTTRDSGENWDLVCEAGIGYQNIEPPVALLGDGSIIAALSTGIAHGDPSACSFGIASDVAAYIADVSRVPGSHSGAVAVSVDIAATVSQVWHTDDGSTWAPLGSALTDMNAATLDVAALDASTVYVSGMAESDAPKGVLARTVDGGQTWTRYDVPGASKVSAPYIAAVSETDPKTVYVRLSGVPGRLLVTRDGGANFESLLDFTGPFDGFALSPDGQFALASGRVDGVWRAPTSTLAFERLSCAKLRCLSWGVGGLFACADEFEAGFLVGQSSDQGASFAPSLHLSCVRGPLACAASTTVGAVCTKAWPAIAEQLGTDCASASAFTPSTQCRDAGTGESDAAPPLTDAAAPPPDGSAKDAGKPSTVVTRAASTGVAARGGCGCSVVGDTPASGGWISLVLLGFCWSRRRPDGATSATRASSRARSGTTITSSTGRSTNSASTAKR